MNFRMTSYADNFEDVMIQRAFDFDHRGFYIDIGAYNPVEHSVTKHFSTRGWRGINVEPNPVPFELLLADRQRDINLNIGLSNQPGNLTLFAAPGACWSADRNMLTGYFGADASQIVERTIKVRTLAEICRQYVSAGTTIDFLTVDVEGHEREVLEGGDWSRWRPRIIVAESNGFEAWENLLLQSGYHFTHFDGVNRFYVRDEDAHLIPRMSIPVNASDRFSIFGYARKISELEESLNQQAHELDQVSRQLRWMVDQAGGVGPGALRVAHQISRASKRFPGASRLAKRVARRLLRRA